MRTPHLVAALAAVLLTRDVLEGAEAERVIEQARSERKDGMTDA
jgi:hypothetical protein